MVGREYMWTELGLGFCCTGVCAGQKEVWTLNCCHFLTEHAILLCQWLSGAGRASMQARKGGGCASQLMQPGFSTCLPCLQERDCCADGV